MSTPTEPFCVIRDALGLSQLESDAGVVACIRALRLDSARMSQVEAESYVEIHQQVAGRVHVAVCARMAASQSVRGCLDLLAGRKAIHTRDPYVESRMHELIASTPANAGAQ